MVITTQAGKSFIAGVGTGYGITSEPEIKQDTGDKMKDYYNRTGDRVYTISYGCHMFGKYDSMDRARKVAADFQHALDTGAQAFIFPAK